MILVTLTLAAFMYFHGEFLFASIFIGILIARILTETFRRKWALRNFKAFEKDMRMKYPDGMPDFPNIKLGPEAEEFLRKENDKEFKK